MSCWTLAQATLSSVSGRRQQYLLISTLPLLLHFSSVSLCPTSRVGDPPGSPFHSPHLNFLASQQRKQGTAPTPNNAYTVPRVRQWDSLFWFIPVVARNKHTIFAIFSLQQVTPSIMAGWNQSPNRNLNSVCNQIEITKHSAADKVCRKQTKKWTKPKSP